MKKLTREELMSKYIVLVSLGQTDEADRVLSQIFKVKEKAKA